MKKKKENFGKSAEDIAVEQLGVDKSDVVFTEAYRPRTEEIIAVCPRCQTSYGKEQFPDGTLFD